MRLNVHHRPHDYRGRSRLSVIAARRPAAIGSRSASAPPSPRQAGFTLIELMVVLVIIGVMTAAIIPEMRGTYQDARLRAASREFVNVFDIAGSRAISFNQIHRVRLDMRDGKYLIERRVRGDDRGDVFEPLKDVPGSEGTWDKRIAVSLHDPVEEAPPVADESAAPGAGVPPPPTEPPSPTGRSEDTVTFFPDGTADGREIQLRDADGFRVGLRINPVTARIRIIELDRR